MRWQHEFGTASMHDNKRLRATIFSLADLETERHITNQVKYER